jgi:hypothetical protein
VRPPPAVRRWLPLNAIQVLNITKIAKADARETDETYGWAHLNLTDRWVGSQRKHPKLLETADKQSRHINTGRTDRRTYRRNKMEQIDE